MSGPGLQAVRVAGGLVPPGLFGRIQAGEVNDKASLSAGSYHLAGRETVRDAANRAWSYLCGRWADWREAAAASPGDKVGTGRARSEWLTKLFEQLGYGQLQPTRGGIRVDDTEFPVSHSWQHVPIHLLGPGADLDKRNPGVAGAARAPQAMVQELLNRTDEHLWAFLSNGLQLRLLRDSTSLAGSAYVEFDLETIFDGQLFSEFMLLWQLCHVSRAEKRGGIDAPASDCWLETWREEVRISGTRALKELRVGVKRALEALGTGFLEHKENGWLREALRAGELRDEDLHRALLRLVYRLLFLSVAEARSVLHLPGTPAEARERYSDYYSVSRLRQLARVRGGGPHGDLWESLQVTLRVLGGEGLAALGLPALAGLFDPADSPLKRSEDSAVDLLAQAALSNANLLEAMRSLGWVTFRGQRVQPVDYRNLGAEELGSIYESLLELVPRVDIEDRQFRLENVSGNERKTTGSYYTPTPLVDALLDSALDPLLAEARKNAEDADEWERNLLSQTVCDPACGSGHFLVAAARRIARELAEARSGEDEPTPADVQHALRDVVGNCIYGVDVNPMAAELAKVSLWLEALEPGKPLGFLDSRIRVGNSLLGTTPALIAGGLPDDAFKPLEGDDKSLVRELRKRNATERAGQASLFDTAAMSNVELAAHRDPLLRPLDDADAVREQAQRWREYEEADERLARQRGQADAWCAAFVWKLAKRAPEAPTSDLVRRFLDQPGSLPDDVLAEVNRLEKQYSFFHWHLEFPEIFQVPADGADTGPQGWTGGFSCILGNPPWERVKLQEQEFFAARDPEIARAPNKAARTKMIDALLDNRSPAGAALHQAYLDAKRQAEGESTLLRNSGRYPLTGRGDVNTYAVFADTFRALTGPVGRSGVIVPTGIATDATTQFFFRDLVETQSLVSVFSFREVRKHFIDTDDRTAFCLFTISGREIDEQFPHFAFSMNEATEIETASYSLAPAEILLLNPNTGTCPVFRSRRDAEITLGIYRRVPVLVKEGDPNGNPWDISFMTMFHMSNDSHLFHTREELEAAGWTLQGNVFTRANGGGGGGTMLPLHEAKMIHHFDHRWATYDGTDVRDTTLAEKQDPNFAALPRYWVPETEVDERLDRRRDRQWLLGWRDVSRSTDERTMIVGHTARVAVGHKMPLMFSSKPHVIYAILSSFALDYVARNKVGGTSMTYFIIKQLPVPTEAQFSSCEPFLGNMASWIEQRVRELSDTSHEITGMGVGPFQWEPERRALMRAELDGALFHLYGLSREDVDHMLDTFPIVRRKDEATYGEYRTKRLILDVYDKMAEAIQASKPYQTLLDPPPGRGHRHRANTGTRS